LSQLSHRSHLPRLYAILDVDVTRARGIEPLDLLDAWLGSGVRLVQLRAKTLASGPLLALADAMVARTRRAGATCIVNDRADIARMAGADGVHVGQDDLTPRDVRRIVGAGGIVGLSTHASAQVEAALLEPISYVAIGPVFATRTKPDGADPVGLAGVRQAADRARTAGLPVVAIGGITLGRVQEVLAAGASAVAVISDLLAEAPGDRAGAYVKVLSGE
jgi:thiamine-phosphate pyrophosphorylase